jgi:hypothetical protein
VYEHDHRRAEPAGAAKCIGRRRDAASATEPLITILSSLIATKLAVRFTYRFNLSFVAAFGEHA